MNEWMNEFNRFTWAITKLSSAEVQNVEVAFVIDYNWKTQIAKICRHKWMNTWIYGWMDGWMNEWLNLFTWVITKLSSEEVWNIEVAFEIDYNCKDMST